jgi:hypothetical protein
MFIVNFASCWNNNNACPRLWNVFLVFFVIFTSSYFGGCNLANLSGCITNGLIVDKSALSILLYYFFSAIFEISFKSFSWSISRILALSVSISFFLYIPDSLLVNLSEIERYLAFLWLSVQGLIIIDIAHEVNLFIIKQAELAYNFRGAQAAKPWYILHMVISVVLLSLVIGVSYFLLLYNGGCIENEIAIGMILSFALLCICFSVSEQCNKGILIPSIICAYSLLLCFSAVLSNSNSSCRRLSVELLSDTKSYRMVNLSVKWFQLLTSITSIVYAAVTGPPSLVWTYKCMYHYFLSLSRGQCLKDPCCGSTSTTGYHLELGIERDLNTDYYSNQNGGEFENASIRMQTNKDNFTRQSTVQFASNYQEIDVSSPRGGGEQTYLLSDNDRLPLISSNPDYTPCSSKVANNLDPLTMVLSNIQLGFAACYLAMLLCDWTERNSLKGTSKTAFNQHEVIEAMYFNLMASIFVWTLYMAALLKSYYIYRQHNRKLRMLINV